MVGGCPFGVSVVVVAPGIFDNKPRISHAAGFDLSSISRSKKIIKIISHGADANDVLSTSSEI
ncbi:hypothetical protein E8E14_005816 [Neopestalotiopsis sp. 37M]|nr:hypothetical protein E8E14_005816 [Neopestalotiopsis sp. 37M]